MPNKTISIMQPGYLPYSGFFELMSRVDTFVIYDDVQYDKGSWRNRNQIRNKQGALWLTVPVLTSGMSIQAINDVQIDNRRDWRRKHLMTIEQCYSKAKYFHEYIDIFKDIYEEKYDILLDINMTLIYCFCAILEIRTEILFSSNLKSKGRKTDRIIKICKELDANVYISANGAKSYLDEKCFEEEGIALTYQNYKHPQYTQVHHEDFVSHLSVIDLLFNCGQESKEILLSNSILRYKL